MKVCMLRKYFLGLAILLSAHVCLGQTPNTAPAPWDLGHIAPTPFMGWASWNHFFCDYTDKDIREQADALVSTGMRDAGYNYVLIQECIAPSRDAKGNIVVDAKRFPHGMKALVNYIHSLGLKAGTYTDVGKRTCFRKVAYEGSYGHEQQDADTFAAWGMDFVEMDYCFRETEHTGRWVYERMAQAIRNTGRPMAFYICSWGNEQPWEWAQGVAQMWRSDYDISLEKNHVAWNRVVSNFESNTAHAVLSGPESWNDADMLEIGNPGLTDDEAQAHMSMWAISPSGLLAGADLVHMTPRIRDIYINKEVIAVNQDALGAGAEKVAEISPGMEVWAKPLGSRTSGEYAVMLLNASAKQGSMEVRWSQLDLQPNPKVRDLWLHTDVAHARELYRAEVKPHTAVLLRVSGTRAWRHGVDFEAETPSVVRLGSASLLTCGECSKGYSIQISGDNKPGGLRFSGINLAEAGDYTIQIHYVRNGQEKKAIDVAVNGKRQKIGVEKHVLDWEEVPASFHAGDNNIEITFDGPISFYVDKVTVLKGKPSRPLTPAGGWMRREPL